MKKSRKILAGISVFVIIIVVISNSYSFLAVNKPVASRNFVIEGWLSASELEQIVTGGLLKDVDRIFVTGRFFTNTGKSNYGFSGRKTGNKKVKKEGRWLYANSTLVFNPVLFDKKDSPFLKIVLKAKGTKAAGMFAHFNFILNDSVFYGGFTGNKLNEYVFYVRQLTGDIRSLMIRFDNDCAAYGGDRNLFVRSLAINDVVVYADENTTLVTTDENKITTGFDSEAGETISYLKALGVSSEKIVSVGFMPVFKNQTLAEARHFRSFMSKRKEYKDFNIVSAGVHARRSWVTYKTVFGNDYKIGIISIQPSNYTKSDWWMSIDGISDLVDEFFSFIFCFVQCNFIQTG